MRSQINLTLEGDWVIATDTYSEVASQGRCCQEALDNLKEALELCYEDEKHDNSDMPSEYEIYSYPHKDINEGLSDFILVYDSDARRYSWEMEMLLGFDDEVNGPKEHIRRILADFTEWMKENGFRTDEPISFWEYFSTEGVETGFKSIEKAYSAFKLLTFGFIGG